MTGRGVALLEDGGIDRKRRLGNRRVPLI